MRTQPIGIIVFVLSSAAFGQVPTPTGILLTRISPKMPLLPTKRYSITFKPSQLVPAADYNVVAEPASAAFEVSEVEEV